MYFSDERAWAAHHQVRGPGPHIIKFTNEEDHTEDSSARALCTCDTWCMHATNPSFIMQRNTISMFHFTSCTAACGVGTCCFR